MGSGVMLVRYYRYSITANKEKALELPIFLPKNKFRKIRFVQIPEDMRCERR